MIINILLLSGDFLWINSQEWHHCPKGVSLLRTRYVASNCFPKRGTQVTRCHQHCVCHGYTTTGSVLGVIIIFLNLYSFNRCKIESRFNLHFFDSYED